MTEDQARVVKWLGRHESPMTIAEIAEGLGRKPSSVKNNLVTLRTWGDVAPSGWMGNARCYEPTNRGEQHANDVLRRQTP